MKKGRIDEFAHLPAAVGEYIKLVIKKMGYRKCVREDVKKELIHHFEDALKDCKDKQQSEQLALKLIESFGEPKILGKLLKRAKKRCRPLWRTIIARCFQAVGIFVLLIIGYCILITFAKPNITTDYLEKMNNLACPAADESLNAAHDYKKAFEAYKADPNLEKLIDEKQNIKDFNETELAAVRKWIADNNIAIDYYLKAAEKPYCWWDRKLADPNGGLYYLLMPELAQFKKLGKFILFNAKIDARDGSLTTAFYKISGCFKSGIHLKGHRTLVEQLSGIGIQGLCNQAAVNIIRDAKINSDQLKEWQVKLEDIKDKDNPQIYFDAERLFIYDYIQRWFTDEKLLGGRLLPSKELADSVFYKNKELKNLMETCDLSFVSTGLSLTEVYSLSLVSAGRTELSKLTNDYYDKFDELCKLTPYQGKEKTNELEYKLNPLTGIKGVRYWLPPVLFPPFGRVVTISYRNKISNEATICIIALHRYKLDKGAYPDTLDQIQQAGYIKSVPMDPWSDKQMGYKKTGDDFILYSVGENYIDDGGQVFIDRQGKKRIWSKEGGDAVFWPAE